LKKGEYRFFGRVFLGISSHYSNKGLTQSLKFVYYSELDIIMEECHGWSK